jgi:transposase InsO family protein
VENERLRKENEKLARELARAKAALEVVGKAHARMPVKCSPRARIQARGRAGDHPGGGGAGAFAAGQGRLRAGRRAAVDAVPAAQSATAGRKAAAAGARHPAALSAGERAQLLAVLDSPRFADKSPAQAWAILLDEGTYLASVPAMYRVLRAEGQVRERRAQAAHPPRVRPELVAADPSRVWSWDITKLEGPWRGIWLDLYVMLDIFSRKAIWQEMHATENAVLAAEFITNAIAASGGTAPGGIHAGNGTSMTSKTVTDLLSDLKISRSHSRPHVCPLTG